MTPPDRHQAGNRRTHPGITIGIRHYDAATGTITTVREPVRYEGEVPITPFNHFPLCECPRCRTKKTTQ